MAVRPIITAPDPRLKQVSRPVDFPKDLEIVQDLLDTARAHGYCRGLAAVQIGHPVRACVANINGRWRIFLNPKIRASSGSVVLGETCLSFPWLSAVQVARPQQATIEWEELSDNGTESLITSDLIYGMDLRVILHEIDHCDGITIDTHRRRNRNV